MNKKNNAHPSLHLTNPDEKPENIAKHFTDKHVNIYNLINIYNKSIEDAQPEVILCDTIIGIDNNLKALFRTPDIVELGYLSEDSTTKENLFNRYFTEASVAQLLDTTEDEVQLHIEELELIHDISEAHGYIKLDKLLALMKQYHLGESSTIANVIEKMVSNGYIGIEEDGVILTQKAKEVIADLNALDIPTLDTRYTSELETALRQIERGEKEPEEVIDTFTGFLTGTQTVTNSKDWLSHISSQNVPKKRVVKKQYSFNNVDNYLLPSHLRPSFEDISLVHQKAKEQLDSFETVILSYKVERELLQYIRAYTIQAALHITSSEEYFKLLTFELGLKYVIGFTPQDKLPSTNEYDNKVANVIAWLYQYPQLVNEYVNNINILHANFVK
jgi:hypothetical protein